MHPTIIEANTCMRDWRICLLFHYLHGLSSVADLRQREILRIACCLHRRLSHLPTTPTLCKWSWEKVICYIIARCWMSHTKFLSIILNVPQQCFTCCLHCNFWGISWALVHTSVLTCRCWNTDTNTNFGMIVEENNMQEVFENPRRGDTFQGGRLCGSKTASLMKIVCTELSTQTWWLHIAHLHHPRDCWCPQACLHCERILMLWSSVSILLWILTMLQQFKQSLRQRTWSRRLINFSYPIMIWKEKSVNVSPLT